MENEIKNSIEFINKKAGKKTSFSTPSNYFDNLEDVIATKLIEKTFVKEKAFQTPDDYFKNLEDNILSKVTTSNKKETKVLSLKNKIYKIIPFAAAASIILFIGLNSFVFNTDDFTLESLSEDDIEYWMESNTLFTSDIALVLEDDLLNENDFYFSTIQDETIEDYIYDSMDNTDLLNEFD